MSFQVTKIVWFDNDYGIEYIIKDSCSISFKVIKTPDPTLIDDSRINIGSQTCYREGDLEAGEAVPESMENMQDFAIRARQESIEFAKEMIIEHKETLNLSKILDEVLASGKHETAAYDGIAGHTSNL